MPYFFSLVVPGDRVDFIATGDTSEQAILSAAEALGEWFVTVDDICRAAGLDDFKTPGAGQAEVDALLKAAQEADETLRLVSTQRYQGAFGEHHSAMVGYYAVEKFNSAKDYSASYGIAAST